MNINEAYTESFDTPEQVTEYAIQWQNWQSEQNLSWGEVAEWADFFRPLAEKFNLTDEMSENGII